MQRRDALPITSCYYLVYSMPATEAFLVRACIAGVTCLNIDLMHKCLALMGFLEALIFPGQLKIVTLNEPNNLKTMAVTFKRFPSAIDCGKS